MWNGKHRKMMEKIIKWVIPFALVGIIFMSFHAAAFTENELYVNSDNGLHVREKPDAESESLAVLKYGDKVSIIEETNGWYKIKYENDEAYVKKDYLQEEKPESKLTLLGTWRITAYAYTGSRCANGNYPTVGYTIACNSLPFGTRVYIDGVGYRVVEDRGPDWLGSEWCDLYLGDVNECIQWGDQYREVYIETEDETETEEQQSTEKSAN